MAKFDPFEGDVGSDPTREQPRYIIKALAKNRPSIAPSVQTQLENDIKRYRTNTGITRIDLPCTPNTPVQGGTVAVLRTDIPGLDKRPFGGASPEAIPERFRDKPGTKGGIVLVPANPIAANHAEHVALENLRVAIDAAIAAGKLKREQLDGRRVIMRVEQEPCSSCAAGLGGSDTIGRAGVIKQFSTMFPTLLIEIRSTRTSRSYVVQAGKELP